MRKTKGNNLHLSWWSLLKVTMTEVKCTQTREFANNVSLLNRGIEVPKDSNKGTRLLKHNLRILQPNSEQQNPKGFQDLFKNYPFKKGKYFKKMKPNRQLCTQDRGHGLLDTCGVDRKRQNPSISIIEARKMNFPRRPVSLLLIISITASFY